MIDHIHDFIETHPRWIAWSAAVSLATFAGSLLLLPWIIVTLPEDYFATARRPLTTWKLRHPFLRMLVILLKNLLGVFCFLAGILLLFLPGQGLLMMLAGILLMNFPGKHRIERWCVKQPKILHAVNWMRARRNRPPFIIDL